MTTKMEALRAEGNAFFSAKDYENAVIKYTEGLSSAPSSSNLSSDVIKDVDTQRVLLWSNRAACFLQLEDFAAAEKDCTLALTIEPDNSKARYRRAQAYMGLGNLTKAFKDVHLVLQQAPTNKAAATLARKIQEQVREDVHGVQKALDSISDGINGGVKEIVKMQDKTVEALQYLEMKSVTELATLPGEIAKRDGLTILWMAAHRIMELREKDEKMDILLLILSHIVSLLSIMASASTELAATTLSRNNGVLDLVLELLNQQVAIEYTAKNAEMQTQMPVQGRKAIIKLSAFLFKHLLLGANSNDDACVRRVLNGLFDGLRSRERVLQIAALDGLLHFLSASNGQKNVEAKKEDSTAQQPKAQFAALIQELGLFSLLHTAASSALPGCGTAGTSTAEAPNLGLTATFLSRLPLVFTQCVAHFEGDDTMLKKIVRDWCVSPVLAARPTNRSQLAQASASCLLLSALFLSNAKLALWAVQQTGNDGTAFLSRLHDFLVASRTFTDEKATTRQLQEIWVDCVASICGVENGPACVPPALRIEIYRMLHASLDDEEDLMLRASALSIQVKLGIVEKTLEMPSADGQFLMDSVFETKSRPLSQLFWSGVSPKERGIEALSYLITYTPVKDAFVKHSSAVASVFGVDFPSVKDSSSEAQVSATFRSNVYYGIGYILHHVLTSEAAIKRKQMEGMEMTADQYEELQKALKQKSVLDDGDTPGRVEARVTKLAASRVVLTTLGQLLKLSATKSENIMEMATLSALHASEVPSVRGSLVQCGVFQALIPLALHHIATANAKGSKVKKTSQIQGTKISNAAGQAMAKILISTNPNLIPSSSLFSSIRPLLDLCKGDQQLLHFEALMALTNIASVSEETKARIVGEPQGLSTLQYLQFSEHELVRRAATEAICNLLPNGKVIEQVFMNEEKVRLWIAFASLEDEAEDFETARAAGGALAMVSQVPEVCWVILRQGGFEAFACIIENGSKVETLQRALVAMQNLLEAIAGAVNDKEKDEKRIKFQNEVKKRETKLKQAITTHSGKKELKDTAQACLAALKEVID
ncbi:Myosin assembly protein/sexual cycle protein and related proteins [Plasmopara halstedii]|uniref:Myosin assembly protein/sexual cycle protein and related proteins n=1 Tax=Plasmopara halstedii TaxID=4781 RepID=A0A0P1AAN0_PLAHL|nr:Myosin assembly protein/sexual cycle protein and related proteins [Plasmopara halstedii]CEG37740.1 Myosin assembly protein/sexual cycle protein and related proteins [Plasmopara halstedii]|eukprot:XP_024574109.1 Myosin assembly protein/sexual cycle protein and related proteins [Plasmopara halstedii]